MNQDTRLVMIVASLAATVLLLIEGRAEPAACFGAVTAFLAGMWTSAYFRHLADKLGVDTRDER